MLYVLPKSRERREKERINQMKEEILDQVAELKGRRTTMEIVNVKFGEKTFKREIIHRPIAAAAIVETEDGRFIFVKQYRVPVKSIMLEAVAGCVDSNEHPAESMKREIEEETGHLVTTNTIRYLGSIKASPGYSDETIFLFYAKVNNIAGDQRPDDDERLQVLYRTFDEIQQMIIEDNTINDGKTRLAWYEYLRQIRK